MLNAEEITRQLKHMGMPAAPPARGGSYVMNGAEGAEGNHPNLEAFYQITKKQQNLSEYRNSEGLLATYFGRETSSSER